MPFCCIAIVGVAMLYFSFLSLRHLCIGPRRDAKASDLPTPPRAITGNAAQPVIGHTFRFTRLGGDVALLFPPDWREWRWLPKSWSRPLGKVFSIFIWGQWRIVITGPDRAKKVLASQNIADGWAWTPPVTLLGKSCIPLLEEEEADFLMRLLRVPLSQHCVMLHSQEFAGIANQFMDDFLSGELNKKFDAAYDRKERRARRRRMNIGHNELRDDTVEVDGRLNYSLAGMEQSGHSLVDSSNVLKLKWDAMRSYTLDLIDGPVLGMKKWNTPPEHSHGEATKVGDSVETEDTNETPDRARMMRWMDRIKLSLCVIKIPMGPEWMYLWPLTEYGRATIARIHLEDVVSKHVEARSEAISHVRHVAGHFFRDATAMPFPLITWAENVFYRNEGVTGSGVGKGRHTRERSSSEPALTDVRTEFGDNPPVAKADTGIGSNSDTAAKANNWESALSTAENHSAKTSSPPPPKGMVSKDASGGRIAPPLRARAVTSPLEIETSRKRPLEKVKTESKIPVPSISVPSILDHMLSQHDNNGNGLTKAVATELSILLYMILDAGNAWTSMALNLLALDPSALNQVEDELSYLATIHGKENLCTPRVMGQMSVIDALIWEAIRLCPPFLGGMKVVSETILLPDDGVQIPKKANVLFCQPTEGRTFNLSEARGKKPHKLTFEYPCINVHGFLPFKGLEIPLMVMQTKVFIVVLLQRFEPHISRKRTFIRRVADRLHKSSRTSDSISVHNSKGEMTADDDLEAAVPVVRNDSGSQHSVRSGKASELEMAEIFPGKKDSEVTGVEAMKLFTKIPFPEPKVVLHVRKRDS